MYSLCENDLSRTWTQETLKPRWLWLAMSNVSLLVPMPNETKRNEKYENTNLDLTGGDFA